MANRQNRYKAMYDKLVRPNNGANFPRHVFIRSANHRSSVYDRLGDRDHCFESTFVHLTERFTGKEVYLIGTMNSSTLLAQRTKELIRDIKPDTVLVQASSEWWNSAKYMRYVNSQEEYDKYVWKYFKFIDTQRWIEYYWSTRKFLFLLRMSIYYLLFRNHYRFGYDFQFFVPGCEMKFACEQALAQDAKLEFLGSELDPVTWQRLYHETRFNLPHYLLMRFQYRSSPWIDELLENRQKIHQAGPSMFSEKCMDPYLINWYIQSMDVFFPKFKEIFVERRDEDLFKQIDQSDSKKIVAVVNQWHMEGIEHHWCHRYGQAPRSVVNQGLPINPIGDMNLREGLFQRLYNALQREVKSARQKSTPSTYADWMTGYNRETNWQYEHRDM